MSIVEVKVPRDPILLANVLQLQFHLYDGGREEWGSLVHGFVRIEQVLHSWAVEGRASIGALDVLGELFNNGRNYPLLNDSVLLELVLDVGTDPLLQILMLLIGKVLIVLHYDPALLPDLESLQVREPRELLYVLIEGAEYPVPIGLYPQVDLNVILSDCTR